MGQGDAKTMEISTELLAQVAAAASIITTAVLSGVVAVYRFYTKDKRAADKENERQSLIDEMRAENMRLHDQNDEMWQARLDSETEQRQQLQQSLREENRQRLQLTQRVDILEADNKRLSQKLERTQNDLQQAKAKITELEVSNAKLEAKNEVLEEQNQILRGMVEPFTAAVALWVDSQAKKAA